MSTYSIIETDPATGATTTIDGTVMVNDLTTSPAEIPSNGPTTDGTLTNAAPASYLLSNICFPANTPILTDQGIIEISKIDPKIHTIRGKKIEFITKTISTHKHLICFEKNSLYNNVPNKKTIMTENHAVFYNGKLTCAKELSNKLNGVYKIKYNGEILYNVLMEEHDKMIVNGMICETLHPDSFVAKFYNKTKYFSKEQLNMATIKINELIKKQNLSKNKSK